ncbi:MAG TPA: hypothetical protein VFV83_02940, partial [Chthoniobacteraceae bacterium]|nr:hypothetical protein [Chthoniobacteraceae bacterium]
MEAQLLAKIRRRARFVRWCGCRAIEAAREGTVSAEISFRAPFELFEESALSRKRRGKIVVFPGHILQLRSKLALRAKSAELQVTHPASTRFLGAARQIAKTGGAR